MEKFRYLPKTKLAGLPKAPGVYAFLKGKDILYIGKAANIRDRVKNHFPASAKASAGRQHQSYRDNLFMDEVAKVGYLKTDSDIDALLLESQLIKKLQPKYNVMWKDDKKYFYVAITKEKLPRVFLTHQPFVASAPQGLRPLYKKDGGAERDEARAEYIGPFTEGKAIKRVLRLLRRVFPYYTSKKHGPLSCSWCNLNLCPGPNPNPIHYRKNLRKLVSVLQGKRTKVLGNLQKEMMEAAKAKDYEKASVLRDQIFALERVVSHARILSLTMESPLRWQEVEKTLQKIFQSKKRFQRIEAYDISNIQGKEATGSQVTFLGGAREKEWYRKYKIKIAGKSDDFAMMEELVSRRLSHPEWPYPSLMVIDGGKGQLTSALSAFSRLRPRLNREKAHMPYVVALAKKRNELFFPGKKNPVLLRDLPRAVENLFLRIRDEAHRFALAYHRKLRERALGLTKRKKEDMLP